MTYKIRSTASPVYLSCHVKAHESTWTFVHCSLYHSSGLSSWSVPSDAQLHLSGTHYLHLSPIATLWPPSNLGWKLCLTVAYTSDFNLLSPAPLKLRPYGALEISLLILLVLAWSSYVWRTCSETRCRRYDADKHNDIQPPPFEASVVLAGTVCQRSAPRQELSAFNRLWLSPFRLNALRPLLQHYRRPTVFSHKARQVLACFLLF